MNRLQRKLHDVAYVLLVGAVLALGAMALSPLYAQPVQGIDAQALSDLARSNQTANDASIAGSRAAGCVAIADATDCKSPECVIATKAIAALSAACGNSLGHVVSPTAAPAPVVVQAVAPPPTIGERLVGFATGLFGGAVNVAATALPAYMNYRLGSKQSDNNTLVSIAQSNNSLAGQQSTNATMANLGGAIQNTAVAGFQMGTTLGSKPSQQFNIQAGAGSPVTFGNGNTAINGNENRIASPGPCTNAQTNTQPSGTQTTTAPTTTTPATGATTVTPAANASTNPVSQPCTTQTP